MKLSISPPPSVCVHTHGGNPTFPKRIVTAHSQNESFIYPQLRSNLQIPSRSWCRGPGGGQKYAFKCTWDIFTSRLQRSGNIYQTNIYNIVEAHRCIHGCCFYHSVFGLTSLVSWALPSTHIVVLKGESGGNTSSHRIRALPLTGNLTATLFSIYISLSAFLHL